MTKTIKRLLPAALAVLLAGCAMQPVDSTTTRYRVALVAKNNRDSEFWDAVFTGAEAAATEYNLQLTITAPDDEEDYAAQNQLIADAVEDGAQAIVFSAIDYEANAAAICSMRAWMSSAEPGRYCGPVPINPDMMMRDCASSHVSPNRSNMPENAPGQRRSSSSKYCGRKQMQRDE